MDDLQIQMLWDIVQSLGMWAIFAWLFINERGSHEVTRQRHNDDLREIAGLKKPLQRDIE